MKFQYFAWLSEDKESVEDAREVARIGTGTDGRAVQERYTAELGWVPTDLVDEVQELRRMGWLMTIDPWEVERFKIALAQRGPQV
ncbi:hypothetical protein SAMN05216553_11567 [Lentzea fradiae]|uniref:Uncharacterized protein n=1 Tax=Lentzea fradiae TaxID=200378 RepID=A0A1G7Z9U0_9PSEU|nr:hypothetical protein SAMN05216553_11567 [Lentzea fradiae]